MIVSLYSVHYHFTVELEGIHSESENIYNWQITCFKMFFTPNSLFYGGSVRNIDDSNPSMLVKFSCNFASNLTKSDM